MLHCLPNKVYYGLDDSYWPAGAPSGNLGDDYFPRWLITTRSATFTPSQPEFTLYGYGATIRNLIPKAVFYYGRLIFEDLQIIDYLSNSERAMTEMFQWKGVRWFEGRNCYLASPGLPDNTDRQLYSHKAVPLYGTGFPAEHFHWINTEFFNRNSLTHWGGSDIAFLDCRKPNGGSDDGICLKTVGETSDTETYSGEINDVYVRFVEWFGSAGHVVCGADMRWDINDIVVDTRLVNNCASVVKLKPHGNPSAPSSEGTINRVRVPDCTLIDLEASHFKAGIILELGRGSTSGRALGSIKDVKGRIRIRARAHEENLGGLLYFNVFDAVDSNGGGVFSDIDLRIDYEDPYGGVANGVGSAPGYPVIAPLKDSSSSTNLDLATFTRNSLKLTAKGLGSCLLSPYWQVDLADFDTIVNNSSAGVTDLSYRLSNPDRPTHRNIVVRNSAIPTPIYMVSSPTTRYVDVKGEEIVSLPLNVAVSETGRRYVFEAPFDLVIARLKFVPSVTVGSSGTNYHTVQARTAFRPSDPSGFPGTTALGALLSNQSAAIAANTVYDMVRFGYDSSTRANFWMNKGDLLPIEIAQTGTGPELHGLLILDYKPLGDRAGLPC